MRGRQGGIGQGKSYGKCPGQLQPFSSYCWCCIIFLQNAGWGEWFRPPYLRPHHSAPAGREKFCYTPAEIGDSNCALLSRFSFMSWAWSWNLEEALMWQVELLWSWWMFENAHNAHYDVEAPKTVTAPTVDSSCPTKEMAVQVHGLEALNWKRFSGQRVQRLSEQNTSMQRNHPKSIQTTFSIAGSLQGVNLRHWISG